MDSADKSKIRRFGSVWVQSFFANRPDRFVDQIAFPLTRCAFFQSKSSMLKHLQSALLGPPGEAELKKKDSSSIATMLSYVENSTILLTAFISMLVCLS